MTSKGGSFATIRSINTEEQIEWFDTNSGWTVTNSDVFCEDWSGVVLLVSPEEEASEAEYFYRRNSDTFEQAFKLVLLTIICATAILEVGDHIHLQINQVYLAILAVKFIQFRACLGIVNYGDRTIFAVTKPPGDPD
jgi:hypothetical protein